MTKIKGVDKVTKNLLKVFNDVKTSERLLTLIGKFSADRIVAFSRTGKSLVTGNKFKPLSESYKQMRRGAIRFITINGVVIPLAEADPKIKTVDKNFFSPDKSNVTFSGQMLRAIKYKILRSSGNVSVFVDSSSRSGDDLTNDEVAEYVAEGGRPFLGLDAKGKKRIKQFVIDEMRRQKKENGFG